MNPYLRRVTCDNSLKTRTAQLSARGTFHGSHVWQYRNLKKRKKETPSRKKFDQENHTSSADKRGVPGRVCSVGHQRADQQLVAVLSSNVERSIAILVHTINFPT